MSNNNKKKNVKLPPAPPAAPKRSPPNSTITPQELRNRMLGSEVSWVYIESLEPNDSPGVANPNLKDSGKKKNHWVLRLLIKRPFRYCLPGFAPKDCLSVRMSVEPSGNSLFLGTLLLPLGANGNRKLVSDFAAIAQPLLPFEYVIVAKEFKPATDSLGSSSRDRGRATGESSRGQLQKYTNGCRDFTTQWFIRLHEAGYVAWQCQFAHYKCHVETSRNEFHQIIGYRYSRDRIDESKIVMARFPSSFTRVMDLEVVLRQLPDDERAPINPGGNSYRAIIPYGGPPPKHVPVY